MNISLHGIWRADIGDGKEYFINLPGTLDENQIGHEDAVAGRLHPDAVLGNGDQLFSTEKIATRFTRKYTYEGEVRLTRRIDAELWKNIAGEIAAGKRIFLEAERARVLRLMVDGKEAADFVEPTISTKHIFEVTGLLGEEGELRLLSDNSYPGLPHDAIVYSSAATDETQTNWNGVLGYIRLRTEEQVFLEDIRVYPVGNGITVKLILYAGVPYSGRICLQCEALKEDEVREISACEPVTELVFGPLALKENVKRWDLDEGNLYELSVSLTGGETKTAVFGVRIFGDNGQGRLALNGRIIFLRGEANCGVFPESGYSPMTAEEWMDVLKRYRSYGVNCMRFHSHCPPEAAFTAADRLGMLMQPELSHWNPRDAFESEESYVYYKAELIQILGMLANHPSFVMLSLGNELYAGPAGHERMRELLETARDMDPTRLYADSSNGHYGMSGCGKANDFYTASNFYDWELRGTFANMQGYINRRYPNAEYSFDTAMKHLRKECTKPVFGFEVGQYEILPDFGELEDFKGVSIPANLQLIRERVEKQGLADIWKKYVEATGELSRIGYREETEAVLRTGEMSGLSLLGLQDFPGQGTALVGMLNSHLQPKPYEFARPEHFRSFFRDQLPLVLLPKYTWENGEKIQARVRVANYGKEEICGPLVYELKEHLPAAGGYSGVMFGKQAKTIAGGKLTPGQYAVGKLTDAGVIEIALEPLGIHKPTRLNLAVSIGDIANVYPIWVYPAVKPKCPPGIYETACLDGRAKAVLEAGGKVYLTPPSTKEALPLSIQAQFTTDFWSVGTFAAQAGGMGQLIDEKHPLFDRFPTEFHTNWQWWPMASQRAAIMPRRCEAIITEMDSYAYLRPMAQLLECKCGSGRLMFSTLGLQDLQQYPEARALLDAIYCYMDSGQFAPRQEIDMAVFEKLIDAASLK